MEKHIIDRNGCIPRYMQLKNFLKEQIEKGIFKPGDKIHSNRKLMQISKLPIATVSKTISQLINEGVLFSEKGNGTFVSQNLNFDKVKHTTSNFIPFIVYSLGEFSMFPHVARTIEKISSNNGYNLVLCSYENSVTKYRKYLKRFVKE